MTGGIVRVVAVSESTTSRGVVIHTNLQKIYASVPDPKITQSLFYTGLSNEDTMFLDEANAVADADGAARFWCRPLLE